MHPELQSGLAATFHLVLSEELVLLRGGGPRGLFFGIGAEAEQTDDVGHCLSQVLPKAVRVLSWEIRKEKRTLQRGNRTLHALTLRT